MLGAAAGVMGSLQALEVMKEITGIGESLAGKILIYERWPRASAPCVWPPTPHAALCG